MSKFVIFIGLVAGNFFYQYFLSDVPSFSDAFKTSFYQGVAILATSIWSSK